MRDVHRDEVRAPALRLEGFEGEWERMTIGDVFDERVESFPEGELLSVTTSSGIKKFSEVGRHDTSNADKSKYRRVEIGDIAYNSMRMWQGASGRSPYLGIVSPAYTVLAPKKGVCTGFFARMFKNEGMIQTFEKNSQGLTSDTWNLKFPALSRIEVSVPTTEEQSAISAVFDQVETMISSATVRVQSLTSLKKAMQVKMFPQGTASTPEVRFEGFEGDWEVARLGDVAPLQRGFDLPWSDMRPGPYPVVGSNGVFASHDEHMANGPGVTLGRSGSVGRVSYINSDYWPHNTSLWVTGFNDNDPQFIFRLFQHEKPERLASGSGVPTLNRNDVHAVGTRLPSLPEQQAIGAYFRSLDALIDAEQKKLTTLRNLKSALLTQMFV